MTVEPSGWGRIGGLGGLYSSTQALEALVGAAAVRAVAERAA